MFDTRVGSHGTIFERQCHWGLKVRAYLDTKFPGRWIGRDGPTPWSPRSPDLTPLDFFLWGFIKTQVFKTPVTDLVELRHRIIAAFAKVTRLMLSNAWRETASRLQELQKNGGTHIEIY